MAQNIYCSVNKRILDSFFVQPALKKVQGTELAVSFSTFENLNYKIFYEQYVHCIGRWPKLSMNITDYNNFFNSLSPS